MQNSPELWLVLQESTSKSLSLQGRVEQRADCGQAALNQWETK